MRSLGRFLYIGCVVMWLFIAVSTLAKPAYGYVDPGSGLFVTQILGSMFVGFTFLIRKRIRQVFGIFSGRRKTDEVKDPEPL
jgi:hypothetical protein